MVIIMSIYLSILALDVVTLVFEVLDVVLVDLDRLVKLLRLSNKRLYEGGMSACVERERERERE